MVLFGQPVVEKEIIYTKYLSALSNCVNSGQYATVLVELASFDLDYFSVDHPSNNLLDSLSEVLNRALACFRCVKPIKSERETIVLLIEPDNRLDSVSVDDLAHLGQENFVVQRELTGILLLQ